MKTADPELMRAINRYHVIDAIRRDGPIARVQIAEQTELSRATVSAITGALIEDGVVRALAAMEPPADSGPLARGRPRVLLDLNEGAYTVVGVRLSVRGIGVCVTDARGRPIAQLDLPVRAARQSAEVVADLVEDGVRRCVADAGLGMAGIAGIGVGLPGIVDGVAGVSHWSPVLGPEPVPFAAMLERRTGVRSLIDNDANLVLVAEHWFGHGRGRDTFAVITVEDTVGMGLMIGGRPHRGAHGVGPELGHVKLDPNGPECRCGQRGCLDAYASDEAIVREAARVLAAEVGDGDGGVLDGPPGRAASRIAELALAGRAPPRLVEVFRRAGQMLGLAAANVVNMLNPPLLILSGAGLRAGDALITGPLLEALDRHAIPTLREATEVVIHPWGEEMWARGAASIALRRVFEAPWATPWSNEAAAGVGAGAMTAAAAAE